MNDLSTMGMVHALWRRQVQRSLSGFGITFSQYQLIHLARRRGATSPSAAAAELGWDRPTTTLVLRKCLAAGWLWRSRSAADRRSARLVLSGQGEELLDKIEAARPFDPPMTADPLDVLDSEERAKLRRMLDKIQRRALDIL
jgi:DNA-binding MarR family transcriptional regulator